MVEVHTSYLLLQPMQSYISSYKHIVIEIRTAWQKYYLREFMSLYMLKELFYDTSCHTAIASKTSPK